MPPSRQNIPIKTLHLFPVLDKLLIELLQSLTPEEWELPTIAKLWKVKDVAAHLLDGNIRTLAFSRDNYFGEKPVGIHSYTNLIDYLNKLNAVWVNAMKRVSPAVLIELLRVTGKDFCTHLQTLNPFDDAVFPVAWAGQEVSANWFHIAREYTEKFVHQQQIRDAVGKEGLFTKELFFPFIDTFMYALPHTYKSVDAPIGTVVQLKVLTVIGGEWNIMKIDGRWELIKKTRDEPASTILIAPGTSWKLFSKSITPQKAINEVEIIGDMELGKIALEMVAVMA